MAILSCVATSAAWFTFGSRGYKVPLKISAEGLDTTKGTLTPVRIVGTTDSGKTYTANMYSDLEGKGAEVPETGTYEFTMYASPIGENGQMYKVSGAKVKGTVSKKRLP
ncbi:hypothetical protein [Actinotignum urinale]|uniref:Uncharacterized protein n=1 Tax=Actinotignum urinale TaxID=190146 RepID=A0AAW9HWG7_9ACTO|nr:hypothetical protein [Actinotignum urinale]MDY5128949.1 hypothetical protein [Actinotignum urinale]MDY5154750.1 hypothetical protein [Actinotignum urinale]